MVVCVQREKAEVDFMSYKLKLLTLDPLSRTAAVSSGQEPSVLKQAVDNWWGVPLARQNARFLHSWMIRSGMIRSEMIRSRAIDGAVDTPIPVSPVNERDAEEQGRKFRDMFLGITLAVGVSASFWTGVGLLVSKLLR
jgi:hypothetical protein